MLRIIYSGPYWLLGGAYVVDYVIRRRSGHTGYQWLHETTLVLFTLVRTLSVTARYVYCEQLVILFDEWLVHFIMIWISWQLMAYPQWGVWQSGWAVAALVTVVSGLMGAVLFIYSLILWQPSLPIYPLSLTSAGVYFVAVVARCLMERKVNGRDRKDLLTTMGCLGVMWVILSYTPWVDVEWVQLLVHFSTAAIVGSSGYYLRASFINQYTPVATSSQITPTRCATTTRSITWLP
jgi:hypothetical protein